MNETTLKFKIPSVHIKWIGQSVFYNIAFFTCVVYLANKFRDSIGEYSLPYGMSAATYKIFFASLILMFIALFALIMYKRQVSKRNSALTYSLLLLASVSLLLNIKTNNIVFCLVNSMLLSFSFSLFWLATNASNMEFSLLYKVFLKNISFWVFLIQNFLIAVLSCVGVILLFCTYRFVDISSSYILDCCLVSEFVSVFFLANNAFTSRRRKRIYIYDHIYNSDRDDCRLPLIKDSIYRMFVKHSSAHFIDEIIYALVRIFYHMRVYGKENIQFDKLPAVFVCNHGEELGPICGTTYIPTNLYTWVHAHMCEKDLAFERMWKYTFGPKFNNSKLGYMFTKFIALVVVHIIAGVEPLAVHRDNPRLIMKLMNDTRDCLLSGGSVLIFPEDTSQSNNFGKYEQGTTGKLFAGFAQIGKIFSSSSGIDLNFFPVFINKNKKTVSIGSPIAYNSKAEDFRAEKERIANELQKRMNEFA